MISLKQARRSDRLMRATTSLTVGEFDALARQFALLWEGQQLEQTAAGAPRQRQPGGGGGKRRAGHARVETLFHPLL